MTRWPRLLGLTYGELVWLSVALVLLTYELWAVATRGGDVLTRAMRANAPRWTLWPVGIGIICGHLFGPKFSAPSWAPWLFIAVAVAALARDLFIRDPVPPIALFGIFLLAVAHGAVSWVGAP